MNIALLFLFLSFSSQAGFTRSYQNCAIVNSQNGIRLHWNISGSTMKIGIQSNFKGWTGIGVSTTAGMGTESKPNDAWMFSYIARQSSDYCSRGCIIDGFTPGQNKPEADATQDFTNKVLTVDASSMYAEFDRPLSPTDTASWEDWPITLTAPTFLVWAGHPTSTIEGNLGSINVPLHSASADLTQFVGTTKINFGSTSSCESPANATEWTSSAGDFYLNWTVSTVSSVQYIDFYFKCQTLGWCSFGLSKTGGMVQSDAVTGWVSGTTVSLFDTWADAKSSPNLDTQSDITNIGGSEAGGWTALWYRRKVDTGDTAQDYLITTASAYVVYAMNPTDGTSGTSGGYSKHTAVGAGVLNFFGGSTNSTPPPPPPPVEPPSGPPANVTGTSWASGDGNFKVQWTVDKVASTITFTIECKGTGWCGMQLGSAQFMKNVDIYVGWVSGTNVVLNDYWVGGQVQPLMDTSQGGTSGVSAISGSETGGWTSLTFTRPIASTHSTDMALDGNVVVSYAMHTTSDGSAPENFPQHNTWGRPTGSGTSVSINFLTGSQANIAPISDANPAPPIVGTVVAIFLFYVVVRWIYKIYKSAILPSAPKGPAPVAKDVEMKSLVGQESTEGVAVDVKSGKSDWWDEEPFQGYHYRGSMLVGKEGAAVSPTPPAPDSYAKKSKSSVINTINAALDYRIPKSQIKVWDVLLFSAYVALNLICLFQVNPDMEVAKKFGYVACANAFFIALPVTRNSVLAWLSNIPFDRVIQFHRWLGRWLLIVVTVHCGMYFQEWKDNKLDITKHLTENPKYFRGFWAWLSMILIFVSSLDYIRRNYFEAFFYTHFIFIVFYTFAALHTPEIHPYIVAAAVLYGLDRLIRFIWGILPMKPIARVKAGGVVQLRFKRHPIACLGNVFRTDVGQYVFVNFPQISLLEWHPFSVSSGPRENSREINVKSLGNFTNALQKLAEEKSKSGDLYIRVDGPYGDQHLNYNRYQAIILVCGGIGVTPVMGMLKDIFLVGDLTTEQRKAYLNQPTAIKHVYALWTVADKNQFKWFEEEMSECARASQTLQTKLPQAHIRVSITRDKDISPLQPVGDALTFSTGRPNLSKTLDEAIQAVNGAPVLVFTCGPAPMVNDLWDICNAKCREGHTVQFHHETFEF